jgi:hypothetical protein
MPVLISIFLPKIDTASWCSNGVLVIMYATMSIAVAFTEAHAQVDAGALVEREVDEHSASQYHTVTGTLSNLDLKAGKGMLKTDLGKPLFFDLVRPDLFRSVSVGQRVSIVLNEQGQAIKVMETPPAELLTPADQ